MMAEKLHPCGCACGKLRQTRGRACIQRSVEPQDDFVAVDRTAEPWTQLQSYVVHDIEPLLANFDRSVEWLSRNTSAEGVSLSGQLQQIVDQIRGAIGAPRA